MKFWFIILLPLVGASRKEYRNKLFPEYGVNFRYIGEVKNGLDRVSVVTSIPLPRYKDIQVSPIQFHNCSTGMSLEDMAADHRAIKTAITEWCAKATPYMNHLKKKEKYYLDRLYNLLENDLYSVLPQLKSDNNVEKKRHRSENPGVGRRRRGLGTLAFTAVTGLITLAVESIGSFLRGKQEKQIGDAVLAMREDHTAIRNRLQQFENDFLMYGKYNVESLDKVIETVNSLHERQSQLEVAFAKTYNGQIDDLLEAVSFSYDLQLYLKLVEEEHINQYQLLEQASKDLLEGIALLGQGKLPTQLVSDTRLRSILKEVRLMVRKQYPNYQLAEDHILHYRDMKLVTFSIDTDSHALIISFPVFIKDYRQPSLSLYEIDTVAVPIPDKNKRANSYSQIKIHKPYIAAGDDYYIQLKMTELIMCKAIRHIYYCEELFVVKHKSRHSCASAIFYRLGPETVIQKCKFDYIYNATMPPVVLDGGKELLLANFYGPRSLKCDSKNGGLSKPAPEHSFIVVDRDFLCDCRLDLEHHATILRQLSACDGNRTQKMEIHFIVNIGFWKILELKNKLIAGKIHPNAKRRPQTFDVRMYPVTPKSGSVTADLKETLRNMNDRGRLKGSENKKNQENPQIITRRTNQVLTVTTTILCSIFFALLVVFIFRHFKLHTLVAGLALTSIPKVTEAKPIPSDEKVVCSSPNLTLLATVVTVSATLLWICSNCRHLTWLRGYKYSRACTLYVFLYNSHFYVPVRVKRLTGHMHMYRLEKPINTQSMSFNRNCLWDSFSIDWKDMVLHINGDPVNLPKTITVPLSDKIKARRMIQKEGLELQFMIKQGTNWYNISERKASKLISLASRD